MFAALFQIAPAPAASLDRGEFDRVLARAQAEFASLAENWGETLHVGGVWRDDWVAADAKRWPPDFFVTIYGGIARQPETTEDSLALAVCHELGHGYGGEPYRDAYNRIALEGQADYWAAAVCLPRYFARHPSAAPVTQRILDAASRLTSMLARLRGVPLPSLGTPDPTVVEQTIRTHLEPQCRLDTLAAGAKGLVRPACWYRAR